MPTSRLARLAALFAVLAALLFAIPPLLIQLGLIDPFRGFRIFLLSGPFGLLALVVGAFGLFATRSATGRRGRGGALFASLVGILVLGVIGAAARPGTRVPPIHDITTDLEDPPVFVAAAELPASRARDMRHPGKEVAAQQRAGYPELGPIVVARPPAQVFDEVAGAMEAFGWEILRRDPQSGAIEASDTSAIFRFVDDIVVRLRPEGTGTRIDVRSRSRVGRSDLGANAARIHRLADALER